jgi:hypothetical protein
MEAGKLSLGPVKPLSLLWTDLFLILIRIMHYCKLDKVQQKRSQEWSNATSVMNFSAVSELERM